MTLVLLGFLATVNPAAAALALVPDLRTDRPVPVAAGAAGAIAAYVVLAAAADPLLEALDVSLGTYRLGAGVVMAVAGLRWLVAGAVAATPEPDSDPLLAAYIAFPILCTPGAAAFAVSVGAEDGAVTALVGALVAVVLAGAGLFVRRSLPRLPTAGLVRFLGGLATVVGVIVAVDGVRTL